MLNEQQISGFVFVYTLEIVPLNTTAAIVAHSPHPYRICSVCHWTFTRAKTIHRTVFAFPSARRGFQVLRRITERSNSFCCRTFLANYYN